MAQPITQPLLVTNSYQNRILLWDTMNSIWDIKTSVQLDDKVL